MAESTFSWRAEGDRIIEQSPLITHQLIHCKVLVQQTRETWKDLPVFFEAAGLLMDEVEKLGDDDQIKVMLSAAFAVPPIITTQRVHDWTVKHADRMVELFAKKG